ncbi:hypothetical protein ABT213_08525 [Streptomyces sp. NPDC001674]
MTRDGSPGFHTSRKKPGRRGALLRPASLPVSSQPARMAISASMTETE